MNISSALNTKKILVTGADGFIGSKQGLQETINWFADKENLKQYKAGIYNV